MSTYIITFLLICFFGLSFFFPMGKKSQSKLFYLMTTILIVCVVGLRSADVGADTQNYIKMFTAISRASWSTFWYAYDVEPGFALYCKIVSIISKNPRFFLFITASVTQILISIFLYKECEQHCFSYLIYMGFLFPMSLNLVRQWLALSIVIFSYLKFKKGRDVRGLFLILISASIHYSAIFFVAIYLLFKCVNHKKRYAVLLFSVLGVGIVFDSIALIFSRILPDYAQYIVYYTNESFPISALIKLILYGTLLLFSIKNLKREKNNERLIEHRIMCGVFVILITSSLIGSTYLQLNRIGYYFCTFLPIYVPILFSKSKMSKVYTFVFVILMALLMIYTSYNGNAIVPYDSIL